VKIVENALPDSLVKLCNEDIDTKLKKKVWVGNIAWQDVLYDGILGSCLNADLDPKCSLKVRNTLRGFFPQCKKIRWSYHYWTKLSGINWHGDESSLFGATLYLNDWKKEWGGLFLWEDNGLHCLCPKKGMLVINTKKQLHCVTTISNSAPYARRSIQIFGEPD
tara:strand:- start:93 stop:584 length:492 start_codon:yes stop_codon:yes gene_type:complete